MFANAGAEAAGHILKDMGVPIDRAAEVISSLASVFKSAGAPRDAMLAELRDQLSEVADQAGRAGGEADGRSAEIAAA